MSSPLVTIIMPNRNGARFLGAAIRCLFAQTMPDWELILVDDASADDSVKVAQKTAGGDPRVTILRQEQSRGPGAARNRALAAARGAWIAPFDSDDLMAPDRLERLLKRAPADRAAIVADNLMLFTEDGSPSRLLLPPRFARKPRWIGLAEFIDSGRLYSRIPDLGYLKPMIRLDAVRTTGTRYDERLRIGEDYHFLAQLMASGIGLRFEPAALYFYRKHSGSVSHRMSAADIRALIDAEDRFARRLFRPSARVCAAQRRRRGALELVLVYEETIDAIKRGEAGRAIRLAAAHPRMWPLLTRPIRARLQRFFDARQRAGEGVDPVASRASTV